MAVSSITFLAPPEGFNTLDLRLRANIIWSGGTGPFDVLYEWDDNTSFTSPISDLNVGATSPDEGVPPSDMGPIGTDWFLRVTITDTDDMADLVAPDSPAWLTLVFPDPADYDRYLYVDHNIGVGFGSDADGPLGDGEPEDFDRYLYLDHNIGVGFGSDADGPLGDGEPDTFARFLYVDHNIDGNQPCPFLETLAPSLQVQGGTVVLTGDSFGATQATYVTEIRLYETQDLLGGSFVTMAATSWSDTEVSVTVPNGSSSGFVAVVQTNGSETCDGSAFKVLNVTAVEPDPLMGWWVQTVDKQNAVTADSTILPYNVSAAGFKKIMGAVGSGFIEIPLSDPDIDSIVDPMMRKGVLIRVYLDNVFRYAFYAEKLSHVYVEEGVGVARITGRGMEVVALWSKVLPHDYPAVPTQNPTWVYGSNENFVLNPGFDNAADNPVLQNPGGEDGNDDDGNAEGWGTVGDDLDSITAIQDSLFARTDDWYIEIAASDNHSGMTQSVPVESNRVYHVRCYVKDATAAGMRVTLALGGADDIAAIGVTYPNNFVFDHEILAELDNVASNGLGTPGGSTDGNWQVMDVEVLTGDEQSSLSIKIQNDHHLTGIFVDFGVDDVTIEGWGLGLDPWVAYSPADHATNSFRLDDSIAFDGSELSVSVNPLSSFAGIQQIITLNPNTKYTFSAWLHTASIVAGDTWRLIARLNDGSETFIADTADIEPGVGVWTNFTFIAITPNIEDVEIIFRFAYTGPNNPGPVHMDSFAIVPGEPPSSAGQIVNDILDAMNAAGKLLFLQRTWTVDADSNGKPWPSLLSLDIKPTESLLGVLSRLTALAHEWEIVPVDFIEGGDTGFELNLYTGRPFNPESGVGVSHINDVNGPVITPGDATMSGRIVKTAFNVNTIFAIGDDGIWSSAQQFPYETGDIPAGDPAPLGYRESFGIIEEVITVSASDTTTISQYADARLTDEQGKESQLQLRMQRASDIRPFLDFGVGDSIFIDMPPHNPDPLDETTGLRRNPQRIRAIGATLKAEGADVTFLVDANRVVYEDELAWLATIAQLAERSPAENTGQGTGTVSGTGGAVSIIGGGGGTTAHQHKLGSSEITDRTVSGDISGTLPGPLAVNKIKGMAVSNTIPTEAGSTVLVWNYDLKQWVPSTFQTNFPLTGSWTFRTDTGTTPTAGRLNFDDATTASVTNIYVNELDSVSHDRSLMFGELSDGDDVWVWEGADVGNLVHFVVNAPPSLASDVWTIPVQFVASDGTTPWSQNTAIRLGFLVATSGGGGGSGGATAIWENWSPIVKAGASTIAGMDTGKFLVMGPITFWTIEGTASSGGTGDITITGQPAELIDARTFDSLNPWHVGDGRWENEGVLYDYVEIRATADDSWDLRTVNGFNPFTTTVGTSPADGFAASGFVVNSLTAEGVGGGWEDWIDVDSGVGFENSWVNFGSTFNDARYRKHSDGTVQLSGLLKDGSLNVAAFTLPTGYRPANDLLNGAISANAFAAIKITSAGAVIPDAGATTSNSLENISFDSTGGS